MTRDDDETIYRKLGHYASVPVAIMLSVLICLLILAAIVQVWRWIW